nr:uncharacterized protein LOC116431601 [Nomia melanderi]XP_031843135.1 uncharacterized protein LOC116431601 [Nomia melanderi]
MGKSGRGRMSEEEERNLFDKVLKEDNEEAANEGTKSDTTEDSSRVCDCMRIAEHSSRFSLRVMEAMRSLQRKEDTFLPSCTAEDIVRYIEANYRDDGDLYAQVRTALKQIRNGTVGERVPPSGPRRHFDEQSHTLEPTSRLPLIFNAETSSEASEERRR